MLGVEVLLVFVLRSRGLSDTGVSSVSGVSGSWNWGMELPLIGVFSPFSRASIFFCMTRIGVLSTTTSPPRTQPGDLGSISAIVLTGVSQAVAELAAPDSESTAIGVLSTPSLAERGSAMNPMRSAIELIINKRCYEFLFIPDLRILDLSLLLKDFFSPDDPEAVDEEESFI